MERGRAVLDDVETLELVVGRYPEHAERLDRVHDEQRDHEGARADHDAAEDLELQLVEATSVEQALERTRWVRSRRRRCAVLAGGEQSERDRSPDSGQAVHGPRPDRIVDTQVLEQVDSRDHDDARDRTDTDGPEG